jgi:hypothetical protein
MFRNNFRFLMVLSIVALTLTVAPAYATTITQYNSLASWQAVSSGVQLINFEDGCLMNCPGVSFSGLSGTIGIQDTSMYSWMNFGTIKAAFINPNSTSTPSIRIVLAAPITAFGLNLFSANPNGLGFTINLLSTPFVLATTNGSPNGTQNSTFFGVTSDTPFSTIDVSLSPQAGAYELIDNFRFGTADAQTPEAATFLLIGSGLVGMMALRKRIMKHKAEPRPVQNNQLLTAC